MIFSRNLANRRYTRFDNIEAQYQSWWGQYRR
jgi:hypothetical protein